MGPFKSFNLRKSTIFLLVSSSEIDLTLKFEPRNMYLGLKKQLNFPINLTRKNDRSLDDLSIEQFYKEKDLASKYLTLELYADKHTAMVHVNDKKVYYMYNQTLKIDNTHSTQRQQGVHMLVLHPHTGRVMNEMHHMTRTPIAYRGLVAALKTLGKGRLILLVGVGSWRDYMPDEADEILADIVGGIMSPNVAMGEMWACVATVGGPVWAEATTTIKLEKGEIYSPPLTMTAVIPKSVEDRGCHWYSEPAMAKRAHFCELYEGYGDFCDCDNPAVISPDKAPPLPMNETIPIISITSRRQYKLLGQLRQLFQMAGGGTTPILLSVDGLQEEAKDFAEVMNLTAIFHRNPAKAGTNVRINEHIKFSILHGFLHFKDADKIIILEDDLVLSPDFISYFHQTAPLLDADDSIFAINAFNYNSFVPYAVDASRLYRAQTFPAYGWMVNRKWAQEILPRWAPKTHAVDWDWWLRGFCLDGRSIVAPEVARTFHQGYGGVHVTGWEQALFFDRRPLNKDPQATVNISYLAEANYEAYLHEEITRGTLLIIKEHPCIKEYIPKRKVGTFVIYFSMDDYSDEDTFFALHGCLGAYERGRMENYKFLYSFGYYGNHVYTIGCPVSPYCVLANNNTDPDLIYTANATDYRQTQVYLEPTQSLAYKTYRRRRVPPESLSEEINMDNYIQF
ncbi:unnamed protein product, partial [Meganyctiphanes norvegica]